MPRIFISYRRAERHRCTDNRRLSDGGARTTGTRHDYLAAIESIVEARGTSVQDRRTHDRAVASVRDQLDEATLAARWAAGRAMSLDQIIDYALDDAD